MAREGWPFVAGGIALVLACWAGAQTVPFLQYGIIFFGVATCFMVFFFRDPLRTPPQQAGAVVSAADGRVVEIQPVEEEYIDGFGTRISVFLSPLDVHVNRSPIEGRVDFVTRGRGEFQAAYRPDASSKNQQSAIGISNGAIRLVVKQIVGVLARRISCYLSEGDEVALGQRFGLIRFGSRVDHLLPQRVRITVEVGDRVRAGETIIGVCE